MKLWSFAPLAVLAAYCCVIPTEAKALDVEVTTTPTPSTRTIFGIEVDLVALAKADSEFVEEKQDAKVTEYPPRSFFSCVCILD